MSTIIPIDLTNERGLFEWLWKRRLWAGSCFADTVSRPAHVPSLLSINELRLDALRRLLPAHAASERIHQRAQISQLADGTRLAGASCNRHPVHGITRMQRRSRRHWAVSINSLIDHSLEECREYKKRNTISRKKILIGSKISSFKVEKSFYHTQNKQ